MSRKDKEKLLEDHQRRLQKLKEKQATLGLETPSSILIEIEDIEVEIEGLQKELEALKGGEGKESPTVPSETDGVQPQTSPPSGLLPQVSVPQHIKLTEQEMTLLQHVHQGYGQVLVEKEFGGGYSGTQVLLVLPVATDGRRTARKVTKLGPASELRQERDNYEQYVGDDLPFCVAQVKEYYEQGDQAALNYIFVGGGTLGQAVSLEEYYRTHSAQEVVKTLTDLLDRELGPIWYGQSKPLTCLFEAEYGRHLVEHEKLEKIVATVFPDLLPVEGELLQLPGVPGTYPNPLREYSRVLGKTLEGRQRSYVHGDLHLRNVLVDESGIGRLIDFAKVEERHNLFDFIRLETYVRLWGLVHGNPAFSLDDYIQFETALNDATLGQPTTEPIQPDLNKAYKVILAIRSIAKKYMGPDPNFREVYFPALFLYCLAMMKYYKNDGVQAARLVFAAACVLGRFVREVAQVKILLEGDYKSFSSTEQNRFILALSRILNMPAEQIRILDVAPGSVLVMLEMPEQAAQLLISMWIDGNSLLRKLGIMKVELKMDLAAPCSDIVSPPQEPPLVPTITAITITTEIRMRLIQALVAVPAAANYGGRTALLGGLPPNVIAALNRNDGSMVDLTNIVTQLNALGRLNTGEWPLLVLIDNTLLHVTGMGLSQELKTIRKALLEFYGGE